MLPAMLRKTFRALLPGGAIDSLQNPVPNFVLRNSFQEVWLRQFLIFQGWTFSSSRESPGILTQTFLSLKFGCMMSFHAMLHHIPSYHVMISHILPYDAMLYHVMSLSCYDTACCLMPYSICGSMHVCIHVMLCLFCCVIVLYCIVQ